MVHRLCMGDAVSSTVMKSIKLFPLITVLAATSFAFVGVAPTAIAASDATRQEAVVATRSFPKTNAVKKNILAESTSTQVESGSDWGGVESLNVPQTKSQAEKDQEAAEGPGRGAGSSSSASPVPGREPFRKPYRFEHGIRHRVLDHQHPCSAGHRHGSGPCPVRASIPGLSVCCRRQSAVRLGLLRFRAVGVLPVRCEPAPLFRRADERRLSGGQHRGCRSWRHHRQFASRRHLYRQRHGHQRVESRAGNPGHFVGGVHQQLCDSSRAVNRLCAEGVSHMGYAFFVWFSPRRYARTACRAVLWNVGATHSRVAAM